MSATPDSPSERDAKAANLADNVTQTARVLAVKDYELARLLKVERTEVARQLRVFRWETRFLFVMAFVVILLDRLLPA